MVLVIVAGVAVPQTLNALSRSRTLAAARYLAARMQSARAQAAANGASLGVRIVMHGRELSVATFRDGNHNGLRTAEMNSGVDPPVGAGVGLADLFPGIEAGGADGAIPPPVVGQEVTIFSFSPAGTASSGTMYLRGRDGSQYAVRVLGATGRVRVLRFHPPGGDWIDIR